MANLSGQTIQSTYPGLLNLATATTGITSTYQQIQDGLGNNTNTRISTSGIISPNVAGVNNVKPDYGGNGFNIAASAQAPVANTQNRTIFIPFYDAGLNSYSAITYNVASATTTTDVVTCAFYTLQVVPGYGVAPGTLIQSGITLTSNSTGIKTTTLPSTLSFSGTGGGYYIFAMIISNSGVTPTIRYTTPVIGAFAQGYAVNIGMYLNNAGTALNIGSRMVALSTLQYQTLNNLSSFQTSYSASDISTNLSSTVFVTTGYGFGLNTI
jgi:hypothetical protein